MRIDIELDERSVIYGDLYLSCNGQTIQLSEVQKEHCIDNICPGEYETCIYTEFCKKVTSYILMWLGQLLIAPINMLLMNTESDWDKEVHPTTVFYRCRMQIEGNGHLRIYIKPSGFSDSGITQYAVKVDADQKIFEERAEEKKNPESIRWEMHKYLSRFFSFGVWNLAILGIISDCTGKGETRIILCQFTNYGQIVLSILFAVLLIFSIVSITGDLQLDRLVFQKGNPAKPGSCWRLSSA